MKFIIEQDIKHFLEIVDNKSKKITPIGYACQYGSKKTLKLLIELGANQIKKIGEQKMPPLSIAAMHDHFDCVEILCDGKARVNGKDKFDRTALILAAKNGHTRVASLLLQRGADWNQADSSLNTPLHYAAGFGWIDCVQLLLKAKANLNAENAWKITPINLAMMKNRRACVKHLLD